MRTKILLEGLECYRDTQIKAYDIRQELSYRKQIARQLRTQYVEGICNNPMTLTARWVRGHSRSLKVVPFKILGTVSYSPSIVTIAVSLAISEIFSVKEWPDLEI